MSDNTSGEKDLSEIVNDEEPIIVPAVRAQPYDVPLDQLLSDEANALTPEDVKKLKQVGFGTLGVVILIVLLSIYGCQPKEGSMAYGICSTFLELHTQYPHTLKYTDLEGSRTAVRIYFTSTDPFGQYKPEMIECKFGPDEKMGMKLVDVLWNRKPMDPKVVSKFNLTLPIIISSDPYLVLPPAWENQLIPK
ncbi:MAG: hypothetical protein DI551_00355 [Micavibrio aeruginosavorus]|uniref:Uncharacterized protein n=1 Tax=Micavibrio aeruginosavorus TaxID=349221 RepID=A0A2W5PWC7_9BACT|nr:MAG: hypothetical protein DI551_00355 [Micavibrio aeruginosavorus]